MIELKARYDARLAKLRRDLQLQRKVETHEVEERKNQHIADLVANHESQFSKMKAFYNEITRRNLQTITDLKAKIDDMNEKQVANQALMVDIAEENKTLADPLTVATAEVQSLRADLRDASKDRLALRNAKARIHKLDDDIAGLQRSISNMEGGFTRVESERDELTEKFQATVSAMQVKADQRNEALESKLDGVQDEFDEKSAQLQEVLTAASLDPAVIGMVSSRLDAILDARNRIIKELQHQVARVTKSHNDALRVFEAKLRDMGVDTGDLPFVPLPTTTTMAPAGLVAAPRFKAKRQMGGGVSAS
jgi:chromosome segregation ATPase